MKIRGANSYLPTITPAIPEPHNGHRRTRQHRCGQQPCRAAPARILSAGPTPPTPPIKTSNVNVVAGQIKTSLAVVPGRRRQRSTSTTTRVRPIMIVDVFGYFETRPDDTTAGRIVPLDSPFRALDTREAAFGDLPLGTGTVEDWSFEAFANSVTLPTDSGIDLSEQSALHRQPHRHRPHPVVPERAGIDVPHGVSRQRRPTAGRQLERRRGRGRARTCR